MVSSYAEAKTEIERLVDQFASLSTRNRKRYNEAATRQQFILPLFRALGWNIENTREVSPEERVSRGFVDFAFRIRGIPRFFLETKRIPADLENPRWAHQAINYAWLKGVTWAVLTDFEGLKVFNAEWQETIPARAIFKDLTWEQYLDRFDDLWLLSPPAMEEGALDQAAEAVGKKAKRTPVNRLLLSDLTKWRRDLFRTLRAYNPLSSIEQIDQAVQRILDRLIFIRTLEDREIEPGYLQPLVREWRDRGRKSDMVAELNALFREFDAAYDTRLFAPHLCEELESEPTPFEAVIDGLYDVPGGYGFYDFNAIDADVLGAIYEQYLGYVAQDPEGKVVVSKREKRKARGIYYTPQFVVRYIVEQTLGRFLGETDYERARQVRVLDMACGSGSFLIETFDVLDRYLVGVRSQPTASAAGDAHDLARRMEILTGNLYGVDLDAQAVEIARLNLLLKAVNQQARLPELANIRQGNSLISGTPEELEAAFGPDWREKHPLNWKEEFPQVMERGGFDVIVGNPPYVRAERMAKDERVYWQESGQFGVIYGRFDIFILFVEKAISLLHSGGRLSLIVPYSVLNQNYAKKLRQYILDTCCIDIIVDLSKYRVFEEANIATCILVLRRENAEEAREKQKVTVIRQRSYDNGIYPADDEVECIPQRAFHKTVQNMFRLELVGGVLKILEKMQQNSLLVGELCCVITGVVAHHSVTGASKDRLIHPQVISSASKPYFEAKELRGRYGPVQPKRFIEYLPDEMHRPKFPELFESPKLLIQDIIGSSGIIATYDDRGVYTNHSFNCCVMKNDLINVDRRLGITRQAAQVAARHNILFLLSILNSRLITFYFKSALGGDMHTSPANVRSLPIRRINFDDPADVARHDRVVALVEEMLCLQREKAEADQYKLNARYDLARRIEQLDAEIDTLVYELYGLTEEEIGIVERQS